MYFNLDGHDCIVSLIFTTEIVKLMFNCLVNLLALLLYFNYCVWNDKKLLISFSLKHDKEVII